MYDLSPFSLSINTNFDKFRREFSLVTKFRETLNRRNENHDEGNNSQAITSDKKKKRQLRKYNCSLSSTRERITNDRPLNFPFPFNDQEGEEERGEGEPHANRGVSVRSIFPTLWQTRGEERNKRGREKARLAAKGIREEQTEDGEKRVREKRNKASGNGRKSSA